MSQNNRFLVRILRHSAWDSAWDSGWDSGWGSTPVPRAALLSEDNVIELLKPYFKSTTPDFIKNNIDLSKENIEVLDQILDLSINSNNTKKYAIAFGEKNSKAIPEKSLKYCTFPKNEVHLFSNQGKEFYSKKDAISHIKDIYMKERKDSLYVYGYTSLFKLEHGAKKSILTQNKILYVKHENDYQPYDAGVGCFKGRTLYIKTKTLKPDYIELEMVIPKTQLRENVELGQTSDVSFIVVRNNRGYERVWKSSLNKYIESPIYQLGRGGTPRLFRHDRLRGNKFIDNNNNNN